jgi:hypothetical protein
MLEKIYGSVTVKTDRISSKMTVPMKSNPKSQLNSFMLVIKQALRANGDKQLIDNFCKELQEISFEAEAKIEGKDNE